MTYHPAGAEAKNEMRAFLRTIEQRPLRAYRDFLKDQVANRKVLDVGSVEHSADQAESNEWEFWLIDAAASSVVGVDILAEDVARLRSESDLDIRLLDATSDASSLGEEFDIVTVGDVIEHVTNLEGLIKFCLRHVRPSGKLLFKTPNPFFYTQVIEDWKGGPHVPNVDHTCWLSPPTMAALVARIDGIRLSSYWAHVPRSSNPIKEAAKTQSLKFGWARAFAPDYVYELSPG